MYSCNVKNVDSLTQTQLEDFKSRFSKMFVESKIEDVLLFERDSNKTNMDWGSSRISGIKFDEVYIQFVIVDEIQRDWLLYDDHNVSNDDFKAGDLYYTNYRALFNIKTGKIVDVDREEDNEFHISADEAQARISGIDW